MKLTFIGRLFLSLGFGHLLFLVRSVEYGLLELSCASLYPVVSANWQVMQDLKEVVMVHLQKNQYLLERTQISDPFIP